MGSMLRCIFFGSIVVISQLVCCAETNEIAPGVLQLGTFQNPAITESSGVVSSRRVRGAYWTHNDGDSPILYAFSGNGAALGEWSISGLELRDWEDVTFHAGRIYIADIGNSHGEPGAIYAVTEPNPRRSGSLPVLRRIRLNYPDNRFDAESFFISRGFGYLIEKENGNAHVYRFKLAGKRSGVLERQCVLETDAPVSGADITLDNERLAVVTSAGAYLFATPKKVPTDGSLEPLLFVPCPVPTLEGCAFTPGGLLATAETGEILLFTNARFRAAK